MSRFVTKFLVFGLLLLPFFIWVELNLRQMPNGFSQKQAYLEQNTNNVEILTVGSSYATAINPSYFSHPGFNLGYVAQDLYYDYHLVHIYLPRMKHLRLVIVPLAYFSFETS